MLLVIANVVPPPDTMCTIVSQLQSMYPSLEGLQIVEDKARFKRIKERSVPDRDQEAAQHSAEGTVSLPCVQEQGSGDLADSGDLGA